MSRLLDYLLVIALVAAALYCVFSFQRVLDGLPSNPINKVCR